jgi:hypothetical protein
MENKTGKYFKYAIGEIVLVVIGILIALQINNWNESRKAQIEELNLVKQLLEDVEADAVFFDSRIHIQKVRDTIYTNFLNLHNKITTDSILKLKVNTDPFFSRLAYQSNLINNNPDAYKLIHATDIKSKLRDYQAKYDYVVHSIELSNGVYKEYGLPLQIKYYTELQKLDKEPTYKDFIFSIEDEETVAKFDLFKGFGDNYLEQVKGFLIVNQELKILLENYIKKRK